VARYRIVPERSRIWIDARSSLHPIHSSTDGLEGFIDVDDRREGEAVLAVPAAGRVSLEVDRLSSGNPLEDRELRNRVDAARFPTIDGVLTDSRRLAGTNRYRVTGDVALRGVSRSCRDELSLEVLDDRTVRVTGASTFDVREFGVKPPRLLILRVDPEVAVRIDIIATRPDDAPGR
jgi:polyisoprenoid-binding protein YceI